MGKALFNPTLYEALKRTKGTEVKQPGPARAPAPERRVAARVFEAEPAKLSLGSHPQILLGLSATASYLVIFGLFALLAMAFLVGRASVPVTALPVSTPEKVARVDTADASDAGGPEVSARELSPALVIDSTAGVGTTTPDVEPVPTLPTAGPWRIVVYAGRGADRVAELLRNEGLTDVSVAKVGNSLEVHCGHFPSSRAASGSAEFAKIMDLTLEGVGFKDAYAKKFERSE